MKKGEATQARIIAEAGRMASVRGLAAISLNDIAAAVGLSKSGVFKHFGDKEDLHLAVLEATVDRFLGHVLLPALKLPRGRRRLDFVFDRWLDWMEFAGGPGGCPFVQASVEFDDQPGRVRDFLQATHLRWGHTLAAETRALTEPPLAHDQVEQAIFDMKSYMMGFGQQRRLLDDAHARDRARRSINALLDRLSLEPAAA